MLIILTLASTRACLPDPNSGWIANYNSRILTTIHSITTAQLSSICPVLNATKVPGLTPEQYLSPQSCLGYSGPLGSQGPLGLFGPIGNAFWNPSFYYEIASQWPQFPIVAPGGSLDKNGPLGHKGPLSPEQYYGLENPGKSLYEKNDFAVQLRALGLWSALGSIGPLGALGVLGPLGPLGEHGFDIDRNGNYLDSHGNIQQFVTIDYDGVNTRTYPLYEFYQSKYAKTRTLDTSFMVQGTILSVGDSDLYLIGTQPYDQIVTFVVTPLSLFSNFELRLLDINGRLIATSGQTGYVETIQMVVPANTALNVMVKALNSLSELEYRLTVTGSTEYLNQYNISGDQVINWLN